MAGSTRKKKPDQSRTRDAGPPPELEWLTVSFLSPWRRNPRKNTQAVDDVARSIIAFGWGAPILVRGEDDRIIAGHTRAKAAERLKQLWMRARTREREDWHPDAIRTKDTGEVPVRRKFGLTEAQCDALAVADNKTGEKADWDDELLGSVLADLAEEGLIADLGLDPGELDRLLEGQEDDFGEEDLDSIPEVPKEPRTKLGDVWTLGEHTLVCGDSQDASLWDGVEVEMVWTDPPYGVAYVGKTKDALTIENDKLDPEKLHQLLRNALGLACAATKPGGGWYVAAPPGPLHHHFGAVLRDLDIWRQYLVWDKGSLVLGHSDFHYQHEPIFYGWRPGAEHRFRGDRKQTSVLEFSKPTRSAEHPTMKPVELVEYCIKLSSLRGDMVADPFGGSGTTLIACERTVRRCFTIELDPRYCDVIVERWEKLTGQKAERHSANAN
jgi:site-specific DNA-methyltransferase (adenine-specific)